MTNDIPPGFDEIFGTLNNTADLDKCTSARMTKTDLECQFYPLGKLTVCKIHNGLRI